MNKWENMMPLKAPRKSHINHRLNLDLAILARGLDTISSLYRLGGSAAFLGSWGVGLLVRSAIPNYVIDLHITSETCNLL
jgi:hypothetical protein